MPTDLNKRCRSGKLAVMKMTISLLFVLVVSAAGTTSESIGTVERLDPKFDQLVPKAATLEKLAQGFEWTEGPVWIRQGGFLLFCDIPNNVILKWQEGEGVSEFLKPSGYTGSASRGGEPGSNGLAVDREGRLIICQHGDRQIVRLEKNGGKTVLVSNYQGKKLNSPNDLVIRSNEDIYFTDPPYGLEKRNEDPAKELDFNGVYRLTPGGQLTLLTRELTFPNGIAFSPDEKTLYVANSDPGRAVWMAYEVDKDGGIRNGKVFFDATPWVKQYQGLPDGMKIDRQGNLFATGPGGVNIFSPAGKHLGRINPGQATANCAWGDDGSTLYITADMYLCRIKTSTKGEGF